MTSKHLLIILLYYFFNKNKILADNKCILKINNYNKTIFGVKNVTENSNFVFCEYLGIPYADPPINNLRYEIPRKHKDWTKKTNFLMESSMCMQRKYNNEQNIIANINEGDEDCLYLNVRTPVIDFNKRNDLLPVMIWIHGGSFNFGSASSDINGFDYFIEKEIIVVSLNYRLGFLGFLYVPNSNISANLGLKDQHMAMEWVQENIIHFGGNPRNVTLFGWSAGSASVTYHLYSEVSKNLFQKAIAMSGTMLNPWAFNADYEKCGNTYCDFYDINYNRDDVKFLLQNVHSEQLYPQIVLEYFFKYFGYSDTCFVPTLERDYVKRKIITEEPDQLVNRKPINDVPLLIGHTNIEHCFEESQNLNFPDASIEVLFRYFINEINSDNENSNYTLMMQMQGVYDMLADIRRFAKAYAENANSNVYFYRFSFIGKFGFTYAYKKNRYNTIPGAMHGDDLGYLFNTIYPEKNSTEVLTRERHMRNKIISLWTNFIKFGEPTLLQNDWPPYKMENNYQILDLNDDLRVVTEDNSIAFRLWNLFRDCIQRNEQCEKFNNATFINTTLLKMKHN